MDNSFNENKDDEIIETKPKWLQTLIMIFMVVNPIVVLAAHIFIAAPFIVVEYFILLLLYAVNLEKMTDDVKKTYRFYNIEFFILIIFIYWFRLMV